MSADISQLLEILANLGNFDNAYTLITLYFMTK